MSNQDDAACVPPACDCVDAESIQAALRDIDGAPEHGAPVGGYDARHLPPCLAKALAASGRASTVAELEAALQLAAGPMRPMGRNL